MMRTNSQRGFGLLEAIVALTLISAVGVALFSWINVSRLSLIRVEDANRRQEAMLNVIEFMRLVNPMQEPEGSKDLGDVVVRWRAELMRPEASGAGTNGGVSLYRFGLYKTRVVLDRKDKVDWTSFELTQVGFRRVRELVDVLPR